MKGRSSNKADRQLRLSLTRVLCPVQPASRVFHAGEGEGFCGALASKQKIMQWRYQPSLCRVYLEKFTGTAGMSKTLQADILQDISTDRAQSTFEKNAGRAVGNDYYFRGSNLTDKRRRCRLVRLCLDDIFLCESWRGTYPFDTNREVDTPRRKKLEGPRPYS